MRLRDGSERWDKFVLSGEMALECVLGVYIRMWVWMGEANLFCMMYITVGVRHTMEFLLLGYMGGFVSEPFSRVATKL